MLLRDKAMTTTMFTPFAFFLRLYRVDRYIRPLSKPVGKIATSFTQRKWTIACLYSSLCKETKKFLLIGFFSKNNDSIVNHGTCQWCQLLWAAKCAWKQTWSTIVKVMTLLQPFNQYEFSISWETGNSFFFQSCLQLLYFSWPPPPTQSSLVVFAFSSPTILSVRWTVK